MDNLNSTHVRYRSHDDIADVVIPTDDTYGENDDQREKIVKAISTLSKHQQQLIHMKFNEDLSSEEIADTLGITIQSVYNAVFKTLRSIRKQLL